MVYFYAYFMTNQYIMEIKKEDVPYNYTYCIATNEQCKLAKQCLRALAMKIEPRENDCDFIEIVAPYYIETRTEAKPCRWFAEAKLKHFAKGMRHFYDEVPAGKLKLMRQEVQYCFTTRYHYYKARKGDELISESLQAEIAEVFKAICPNLEPKFDEFVDAYEWNP